MTEPTDKAPLPPISRAPAALRYTDGVPRLEVGGVVVDNVNRAVVVQDAAPDALPTIIFYTLHPGGLEDMEFEHAELLDARAIKTSIYNLAIQLQDAMQLMATLSVEAAIDATRRALGDDAPDVNDNIGYYTSIVNGVTDRLNRRRVLPSIDEADLLGQSWLDAESAEQTAAVFTDHPLSERAVALAGHIKRLNELLLGYTTRVRPFGQPAAAPPAPATPPEEKTDAT